MDHGQSTSPVDDASAQDDIDWRAALLERLRPVVVLLIFLGGLATLAGHRSEAMRVFGIILMFHSVLLVGLFWSRQISTHTKSVIAITSLAGASVTAYIIAGYLPGGVMTSAFVLVLALLLIGRKTFIALLVAFSLLVTGLTIAVSAGWWSGPALIDIDPADPTNWLRTGIVAIILWASLGFSVLFVVDTIERNLARRRAALNSLKKEVAERQAAERGRREAEAIAAQAQKLEAIGQLAAGIAHDFNNDLLVIQGWNETRAAADMEDGQREASVAIQRATDRASRLSRQLLTFARKDVRRPKFLYLGRLVDETAKTLQQLVGAHITVRIEAKQDNVIYADESQVQQMLINLVLNARDAIRKTGNIRISVRTVGHEPAGVSQGAARDWVVLEVEDDGAGIGAEAKEHIFEPFFTTKEPGSGTGLGLAAVFGIVQQSGGHVEFSSDPGRTVFSVYLPSVNIELGDANIASARSDISIPDLRILVLEDDALARQIMVTFLERNGSEVVACADGDAALSLLEDDCPPFDILCSDAVFPGAPLEAVLEGFEKHSPAAAVLICSGYIQQELAIRKVESGEYTFLAKPFTGAELAEKIRETTGVADRA